MVLMTTTVSVSEALADIRHHQWEAQPPAVPSNSEEGK